MSTGRRLYVLETPDQLAMAAAAARGDASLPSWTERYTLDALLLEGYATPATDTEPARLTLSGLIRWQEHCEIHAALHAAERRHHTSPRED